MRIKKLYWENANVEHLWVAHQVTVDEIEEIVFGIDGECAAYHIRRDGEFYVIAGETGGGRLLIVVGEFLEEGFFRVFGARDMKTREARSYRWNWRR